MAEKKKDSKVAEGIDKTLLGLLEECQSGRILEEDGTKKTQPLMQDEKLEILDRALKWEALNRRIPPDEYGSAFGKPDPDEEL